MVYLEPPRWPKTNRFPVPSAMSYVRPGVLIAIIVFALFAAYAFLVPATYRTSALVVVDFVGAPGELSLPEPLEAARRLREAILDRSMLEKLSGERAGSTSLEARTQASAGVRQALEVDTSDAHAYSISYKDTDKTRAQRACNQLARHALDRAPLVLVDRTAEFATDLKRQEQTRELAAFLALHPQVAAEAPVSGDKSPDKDPALSAFFAEKKNLEKRILELESGIGTDNPYLDPAQSDLSLLRRRLIEIDTASAARRQALDAKSAPNQLPPELRAEWKRLLDVVTRSSAEAAQPHASLIARVVAEAPLPASPIDPNRPLLLFFGLVFGAGIGAAVAVVLRASQQRRTKSSRPPTPSLGYTVQMPAPPAVPSGLGPAVPTTPPQPQSNPAPPIIPIPQRPISSAPPGPANGPAANGPYYGNGAGGFTAPPNQASLGAAEPRKQPSSNPPPRRFASTLVLPPAENPTPEERTPDPVLASATKAWDQQIRAHEVPGFAVVKPGSEPPPGVAPNPSSVPPRGALFETRPVSSAPPPEAAIRRATSRPPNPMKVTQPLGSFLPDAVWTDPARDQERSLAIRAPSSASRSASPAPESRYSYVSTPPAAPPPQTVASSRPPQQEVVRKHGVPSTWHPDPTLKPESQRPLCEQLYPFAVESCFVLAVVCVPEATAQKSRVAAELALALAESGHPRILLLEGDFHRPWVSRMVSVDMPMGKGFSQQLRDRIDGGEQARWAVMSPQRSLHVLAEGVMRSPGLILSKQFSLALRELRTYYDLIIIDGPTSSLDVDCKALDAVIDGLITVCPSKGSPALANLQTLFSQKRFSAFARSD